MPKVTLVLLSAAMALAVAFSLGEPRDAVEAKCQPFREPYVTVYHDGWYRYIGSYVGGVYSQIYNYDPYVEPGGPYNYDDATAWSMVVAYPGQYYAQVGWQERPQNFRYTFVEWIDGQGSAHFNNTIWYVPPENTFSSYTVLWNNYAPGWLTFQVDSTVVAYADPGWAQTGRTPFEGEIFGETHNTATQMPGGYQNHEVMKNSYIWYNNAWRYFNGTPAVTNSNYHGNQVISSREIHIWDRACANQGSELAIGASQSA